MRAFSIIADAAEDREIQVTVSSKDLAFEEGHLHCLDSRLRFVEAAFRYFVTVTTNDLIYQRISIKCYFTHSFLMRDYIIAAATLSSWLSDYTFSRKEAMCSCKFQSCHSDEAIFGPKIRVIMLTLPIPPRTYMYI